MINEQHINDHIFIGGALEEGDASALQERGFGTVISLLTTDEPGFHEEESVKSTGMDYVSIPVSPDVIDDAAAMRFSQEVASSAAPVYVHCKGGGRAGIMTLLHLATQSGWSLQHALEEGEKLGVKIGADSPYRPFFESFLQRHSAGERQ